MNCNAATPPAPWQSFHHAMIRRLGVQTFGIIGLGRIGTAVALRAKAFNFRVVFYDPYLPNGVELALGIDPAASLEELLRQTDTLSIHSPLTETRGLLGHAELDLLRPGAVVVNDARGPILDLDALLVHLKSGHIAAAGLDVLPLEPPVEPIPELLRLYPGARAVARRPPDCQPARRLVDTGIRGRHAAQIGRNDARRAADQPAAKHHHSRNVLGKNHNEPAVPACQFLGAGRVTTL
jgi:lactate dehydrogenase-like 2-hydroxyacid dehydrogenase